MEPLRSIRYLDGKISPGCVVYIRPLYTDSKDGNIIDRKLRDIYYKFCRFGPILGVRLHNSYAYIAFDNPYFATMATRIYNKFMFDSRLCYTMKSIRNGLDFDTVVEPPILDSTIAMIRETIYHPDDIIYMEGWKKILNIVDRFTVGPGVQVADHCLICYDNPADTKSMCPCVAINFCSECLIRIVMECDAACPICRTLFDPFDLRLIEK